MRPTSLHARIAMLFVLLILVVQGAGFAVIHSVIASNARATVKDELAVTQRVFDQVLRSNREKLVQAAGITAADFGFRKAVASNNRETIESALSNQADRIHASIAMLVSLDGVMLANSRSPEEAGQAFPFPRLFKAAQQGGVASGLGMIDGQLYQLVAVPVKAPLAIAWVTMGLRMDDELAVDMQGLTRADVSFLAPDANGSWVVLSSSLDHESKDLLRKRFVPMEFLPSENDAQRVTLMRLPRGDYATRVVNLPVDGSTVVAVLQRSLEEAMAPFSRLQGTLLALTLVGLAISVAASLFAARGVTRPIADLIRFTRRIAKGEYTGTIDVQGEDEIGELAAAFNQMQESIAVRESRIMQLAYRDPLTGLPNRALFNERLAEAIETALRSSAPLSLMMIDLDRFKDVNDTLGHHIGDLLLCEVGKRLAAIIPRETATVARLGGDEFAIILPGDDREAARALARLILPELERAIVVEGQIVDVGGSIGIVSCPENGVDGNTLFRRADVAMYTAKRTNAGCAVYDPREDEHSAERLSLMSELRHAVEHDELTMHYQPKIDLRTDTVKYVEGLIRWEHPTRGVVSPDAFIPFAEQTGYIKTITRWVADRVVAQCAAWQRQGLYLDVAMNVSARDLIDAELPETLAACIQKYRVSPENIWIEITESALMDDPVRAIATLDALSAMGLHLSIDDFGTGYSSLSYLKRMPVDELKIDKSFVFDMENDREDETIVRSTIDLGHNMGLKVVAEGVESLAVLTQLRALGCDLVQGFFLSRPLPGEKVEAWVKQWNETKRREAADARDFRLRA